MCKTMEDMRNQSLREGMEEGMKQGMKQGMKAAALRMLADGALPLDKISEFVGLPLDEVKKLQDGETT